MERETNLRTAYIVLAMMLILAVAGLVILTISGAGFNCQDCDNPPVAIAQPPPVTTPPGSAMNRGLPNGGAEGQTRSGQVTSSTPDHVAST
jgi:hypothetical protein